MQQASDDTHDDCCQNLLQYLTGPPDLAIIYKKRQFSMHRTPTVRSQQTRRAGSRPQDTSFSSVGHPPASEQRLKTLTAQSTVEVELMAISYGARKAVYVSNFIIELSFTPLDSLLINCDSSKALHIARNLNTLVTNETHRTRTLLLSMSAGQKRKNHHSPCGNSCDARWLRN